MSLYEDIKRAFDDMDAKRLLWKARATEAASAQFEKTKTDLYQEFNKYQQKKIAELFNQSVSLFYNAYTPRIYKRQNSLFNLLEINSSEDAPIDMDNPIDFIDRDKMHLDRAGNNTLFDTVFMEGWHGGAKFIAKSKEAVWGVHPESGTPYYRAGAGYSEWGKKAVQTKAPYTIFSEALQALDEGEMPDVFQSLAQKHWNILCDNLQRELQEIKKEIYD